MACDICRKIESLEDHEGEESHVVTLGSLDDVLASKCDFHPALMRLEVNKHTANDDDNTSTNKQREYCEVEARMRCGRLEFTHWNLKSPDGGKSGYLLAGPFVRYRDGSHHGRGLPLDASWIDQSLLRKWINSCDTHHEETCHARWLGSDNLDHRPCLLIDASNKCLVDFSGQEYYALSYVWGNATSLMTTTGNIDQLKQSSALAGHEVWPALTETTRNAIELVGSLDSPFLWVDALCVVQDDHLKRRQELEKMSYIFANASVTIIAGTGADANHGLHGFQGLKGPRELPSRPTFPMPNGYKYVEPLFGEYGHLSVIGDAYTNRAWTFQEHVLSHRKIIFENQSIRWECEGAAWYEDIDHEMELSQSGDGKEIRQFRKIMQGIHLIDSCHLAKFVSEFNRRELTYPQDVLVACAGIITVLSHSGTGFISGMPARSFDTALLWQPAGCIDRRITVTRNSMSHSNSADCLPSWSWVGWRCDIANFCWEVSQQEAVHQDFGYGLKGSYSMKLVPTVIWHYADNLDTGKLQVDRLAAGQEHIRYIFCSTRRCVQSLHIGVRMHNAIDGSWNRLYRRHPFQYEILDSVQGRIGAIEISPSSDQGLYTDYTTDRVEMEPLLSGTLLDLVEISTSDVHMEMPLEQVNAKDIPAEWMRMFNDIGSLNGSQKIYNVLWIEWKDGYAERKALGWVDGRAWEALNLVNIDLALG